MVSKFALAVGALSMIATGCADDEDTPLITLTNTITSIVVANPDFDTLEAAVIAAGLADTLAGAGPFTVFAPTDAAFEALPDGTLDALLADPDALTKVLTYHVVPGRVDAAAVVALTMATTLEGSDIAIEVVNGEVILNGSVKVTMTDIVADNGIIHIIDGVLLPPEEEMPGTITDIVVASDDFSTLEAAVIAANLQGTLAGEGPFTVFAPTNAAFAALPAGTLDGLLADIPALTAILTYHVVPGRVDAAAVVNLTMATTVEGRDITIEVVNGEVILNGNVKVTMTDIPASNGIIHVIDGVLLPPAVVEPLGTITDIVVAGEDFSTLEAAVIAADLAGTLAGEGPFTVFAPTNAAFAALPAGTLDALLADIPALTEILLYHVVSGSVDAATVVGLSMATTLEGSHIEIEVVNGEVILNGTIKVTMTDIPASNGIIHVIDGVLLPPEEPLGTITDIVVAGEDFSTLEAAVIAADLAGTLAGEGPFTVFAPTNAAFDALPAGTLDALLADIPALTDILLYHVVSGSVDAATVVGLTTATTVQTSAISIEVVNGEVILNGTVKVTMTDIPASNGIIHVIDGVLIPPTN